MCRSVAMQWRRGKGGSGAVCVGAYILDTGWASKKAEGMWRYAGRKIPRTRLTTRLDSKEYGIDQGFDGFFKGG